MLGYMLSMQHVSMRLALTVPFALVAADLSHPAHSTCVFEPTRLAAQDVDREDSLDPQGPRLGPLRRIVVIGASASAGFGIPANLAEALDCVVVAPHEPVLQAAAQMLFASPEALGERMIDQALAAEPTLVVAIDFLFWFGYGTFDREAERLDRLERGLAMLTRLDCPVMVSAFPDMSASIGKMLAPAQVPSKKSFEVLNARVRDWVESRPSAILFPLPELLARFRSGAVFDISGHSWPPSPDVKLLQGDDLHPTIEGLASLACEVVLSATEGRDGVAPEVVAIDPAAVTRALKQRAAEKRAASEERRKGGKQPRDG